MLRVLIVDDDPVNKLFLTEVLAPHAVIDTAPDGRAGLRAYQVSLENRRPYDLIFMDVMMPGMDGHQALEEIRHLEDQLGVSSEAAVKVIMISALDDVKVMARAFFQGHAMSFLHKPFTSEALLDELRKFDLIASPPTPAPRSEVCRRN